METINRDIETLIKLQCPECYSDMNQIKKALDEGLSREQERIINLLVGVTIASGLSNSEKNKCVKFIRDIEEYINFEGFED